MKSHFHSAYPVTVYLRNRSIAVVKQCLGDDSTGFPFIGELADAPGVPEVWRRNGRWRLLDGTHPLDIVGEVVGSDPVAGTFTVVPYAPAAGAQGGAS